MTGKTLDKNKIPDVQDGRSSIEIPLNFVGVSNVVRRLRVNGVEYDVNISAYIELPSTKRGAHLSRLVRVIDNVVEESMENTYRDFKELLVDMCSRLVKTHPYTRAASVELETRYFYNRVSNPVELSIRAVMDASGMAEFYLSLLVYGLTACPCAQAVFSAIEDTEPANTPTHMQRTLLKVSIKSRRNIPRINDVIELMLSSFSGRLEGYLDRVSEYKLIKSVLGNPLFAEDVARNIAYKLYKYFESRNTGYVESISILVKSSDSIHPHDIVVETRYTMDELRRFFLKKQSSL